MFHICFVKRVYAGILVVVFTTRQANTENQKVDASHPVIAFSVSIYYSFLRTTISDVGSTPHSILPIHVSVGKLLQITDSLHAPLPHELVCHDYRCSKTFSSAIALQEAKPPPRSQHHPSSHTQKLRSLRQNT